MSDLVNNARVMLEQGKLTVGVNLRQARTPDIARILRDSGFHWMFIDHEHSSLSIETSSQIALAGIETGIAPIVRASGHSQEEICRYLTNGALGIIAPHVDTPEQAAKVAAHCRFWPRGDRTVPPSFPHLGYKKIRNSEAAVVLNREALVVVMLETATAIENADAIAAVEGVDVLFIGSSDLSFNLGIPGQYSHPKISAAMDAVIAACRKHGKHPGLGGVADDDVMADYVKRGMRFVLAGNDLQFLVAGASRRAQFFADIPLG